MVAGSIARRYAKALLELAQEDGLVEVILENLIVFERLLGEAPILYDVLTNRSFTSLQQSKVLREILGILSLHDHTKRFLLLLVEKHRMLAFESILREFRRYYDQQKGYIRVTVTSAITLSSEVERQLVSQIEASTKKKVLLSRQVEQKLIGGVVTRIGDLLFDGSLSTQLSRLKSTLLQTQTTS